MVSTKLTFTDKIQIGLLASSCTTILRGVDFT